MIRQSMTMSTVLGAVAATFIAYQVGAGGDKVIFPDNYASGVMYMTINRPVRPTATTAGGENSAQFREHYVTPAAIDAVRKGEPIPSGTVMTMVQYRAKLDNQGNPITEAAGVLSKPT